MIPGGRLSRRVVFFMSIFDETVMIKMDVESARGLNCDGGY